jgi:hypothetical protein
MPLSVYMIVRMWTTNVHKGEVEGEIGWWLELLGMTVHKHRLKI